MDNEKVCFMVGHAHIDAAWLWRKDETERACQATFTSGEALVRQVLYGKRYFLDKFGVEVNE